MMTVIFKKRDFNVGKMFLLLLLPGFLAMLTFADLSSNTAFGYGQTRKVDSQTGLAVGQSPNAASQPANVERANVETPANVVDEIAAAVQKKAEQAVSSPEAVKATADVANTKPTLPAVPDVKPAAPTVKPAPSVKPAPVVAPALVVRQRHILQNSEIGAGTLGGILKYPANKGGAAVLLHAGNVSAVHQYFARVRAETAAQQI